MQARYQRISDSRIDGTTSKRRDDQAANQCIRFGDTAFNHSNFLASVTATLKTRELNSCTYLIELRGDQLLCQREQDITVCRRVEDLAQLQVGVGHCAERRLSMNDPPTVGNVTILRLMLF